MCGWAGEHSRAKMSRTSPLRSSSARASLLSDSEVISGGTVRANREPCTRDVWHTAADAAAEVELLEAAHGTTVCAGAAACSSRTFASRSLPSLLTVPAGADGGADEGDNEGKGRVKG